MTSSRPHLGWLWAPPPPRFWNAKEKQPFSMKRDFHVGGVRASCSKALLPAGTSGILLTEEIPGSRPWSIWKPSCQFTSECIHPHRYMSFFPSPTAFLLSPLVPLGLSPQLLLSPALGYGRAWLSQVISSSLALLIWIPITPVHLSHSDG